MPIMTEGNARKGSIWPSCRHARFVRLRPRTLLQGIRASAPSVRANAKRQSLDNVWTVVAGSASMERELESIEGCRVCSAGEDHSVPFAAVCFALEVETVSPCPFWMRFSPCRTGVEGSAGGVSRIRSRSGGAGFARKPSMLME